MKKAISIIILVFMLVSTVSCATSSSSELDGIADYVIANYTITDGDITYVYEDASGDTATIISYTGPATIEKIVVPEKMNGRVVSGIGKETFYNKCTSVKEIVLPSTVRFIGAYAFSGCDSLESIVIPEKVTYIDEFAFCYCNSLKSVVFAEDFKKDDNGVETTEKIVNCQRISNNAFSFCKSLATMRKQSAADVAGINIPDSVTEIGAGAFLECESITTLTLPNSLVKIGKQAFYKCEKIENVTFPTSKSLTSENLGMIIFSPMLKDKLLLTVPEDTAFYTYVNNIVYKADDTTAGATDTETETTSGQAN